MNATVMQILKKHIKLCLTKNWVKDKKNPGRNYFLSFYFDIT